VSAPGRRVAAGLLATGLVFAALAALRLPAFYESFLYLIFSWIALATSWSLLSGTRATSASATARSSAPVAARAYVLEEGRIVADGTPAILRRQPSIRQAYLGVREDADKEA
jgi:hypothetical protein